MKTKNLKYGILLVLAIISLLSSLILSFIPTQEFCDVGGESCGIVHNSPYGHVFGIQNSYYGVVIFLFLSLLIYSQIKKPNNTKRNLIQLMIIAGSLIAIYFLYLQHFIIEAYCSYCIIVDFSVLVSLGIIIWEWRE